MNTNKMYMLERYDLYKQDCKDKDVIPVDIEIYEKEASFPIEYNFEFIKESNEKVQLDNLAINEKDYYTYEEAAEVLRLAVTTTKHYATRKEYGLIRLSANTLSKESVDNLALERLNNSKDFELKTKYEKYAENIFLDKKVPISYKVWLNESNAIGSEENIDLEKYITFSEALEIIKLQESTLKAYIRNGYIKSLVPGLNNYLLKYDVENYYKNMQKDQEEKKLAAEKKKNEEVRLEQIKEQISTCFIGGYIQCNNSFIKESTVTHFTAVYNQIMIHSSDDLNGPTLLSDKYGNPFTFSSEKETRESLILLLKRIENKKSNHY